MGNFERMRLPESSDWLGNQAGNAPRAGSLAHTEAGGSSIEPYHPSELVMNGTLAREPRWNTNQLVFIRQMSRCVKMTRTGAQMDTDRS